VGEKKKEEGNAGLVIVIVIIVIILGVVLAVLMFMRKKKRPEPVDEKPEPEEWDAEESMGAVMEEDIEGEGEGDDDGMISDNDKCLFCSIILDPVDGGLECSRCGASYDLSGKLLDDDGEGEYDELDKDFASLDEEDDFDWADE